MAAKRIALTGGIATGKSTAARLFEELGAIVLDADRFAREAVQPSTRPWGELQDLLGPDYFQAGGELDRRKLRERIIADPECRRRVNAILHPHVVEAMRREWQKQMLSRPEAVVLFDIPLLFEAELDRSFDSILLVYAPREVQIRRLMARDAVSREEAEETLSMQLPIDSKKSLSDYVIDNSGDREDLARQVERVWRIISAPAQ